MASIRIKQPDFGDKQRRLVPRLYHQPSFVITELYAG
jgi:hypothetical protein